MEEEGKQNGDTDSEEKSLSRKKRRRYAGRLSVDEIIDTTWTANKLCYFIIVVLIIATLIASALFVSKIDQWHEFATEIFAIFLFLLFLIITCIVLICFRNTWSVNFFILLTVAFMEGFICGEVYQMYNQYFKLK